MPSGHYMYHQFNIQQFFVLLTQCIHVFCVDRRTPHQPHINLSFPSRIKSRYITHSHKTRFILLQKQSVNRTQYIGVLVGIRQDGVTV